MSFINKSHAIVGRALRLPKLRSWATQAVAIQLMLIFAAITFAAIDVSCWDAASEFNDSANPDAANPSGVWSCGWKETLTGKFFLARTPFKDPPKVAGWSSGSGYPMLCRIVGVVPATVGVNPSTFPPHALCMHPGPKGEYAVLRFTAPADGTYKVSGQFYAQDDNATGTTTDVWILPNENKTGAFSGKVDYYGGAKFTSFTSTLFQLKKGNTLDFQVGYGANKSYFYDGTGLNVIIEKVK